MMAELPAHVLREIADRTDSPAYERWWEQVGQTGFCQRPVRLSGKVTTCEGKLIYTTAKEPDGVLLKACGNRRESVCVPCSKVYKADAWHLVKAGMRGGKGVPESVSGHPMVFVTLTAPSFGAVHQASSKRGHIGRCLPRRDPKVCEHGVKLACWKCHADTDELIGQPICLDCFDYENAVIWNALAPELWRRTTIYTRRALAKELGLTQADMNRSVRLSFLKVAEYQLRGLLHFHAIIRLDALAESLDVADVGHLEAAIRSAASSVSAPAPSPGFHELRWGKQVDVAVIDDDGSASKAAAYIAKYATKHTEMVGGIARPVPPEQVANLPVSDHIARFVLAAHRLAEDPNLKRLRLPRTAHQLGYRGHWTTKSRSYSTTMGALREARRLHASGGKPKSDGGDWSFRGAGHVNGGDQALTDAQAREEARVRRIAHVERRSDG